MPAEIPFVRTTSCAVDLERPPADLRIAPSRNGEPYDRCMVLVRRDEDPLGVVEVDVTDNRVAVTELEAAIAGLPTRPARPSRRTPDDALPPVAVLVPTAGRPDDIERCLASLVKLDYPRMEIVVVDNRPDRPETRRVVERAAAADPRVRYVAEERPGSSVARNRGLAETSTEIVALTDDDVELDPLWLRWMVEPFLLDEQVQAVTGLVLPGRYDTVEQQRFEQHAGFGKGFERQVWDLGPNRRRGQVLYPYWGAPFGSGNSMAFRRPALLAIGGFDPALGAGSPALAGADIESFSHIVLEGGRLVYEPRAVVWHDHRRDEAALARQMFNYCAGATAIVTKWLLRDPRMLLAIARTAGMVVGGLARRRRDTPKEVARLNRQLSTGSRQAALGRQLRGFLAGPALYLRSRRWAERLDLHDVLNPTVRRTGGRTSGTLGA